MTLEYHLNHWGPIPARWWMERDLDVTDPYMGGSVDVWCTEKSEYIDRYRVGVMSGSSWGKLNSYLNEIQTDLQVKKHELIAAFEVESGHEIEWVLDDGKKTYIEIFKTEE